jgi:hypothetical protein
MDLNLDPYAAFQPADAPDPADNSTGWLDPVKAAGSSLVGAAADPLALAQVALAKAGKNNASDMVGGLANYLNARKADIESTITPGGKKAQEATIIPEEGKESVLSRPVGALIMKSMGFVGPAAAMYAAPEGLLGELLMGGTMGASQVASMASSYVGSRNDDDLAKESPLFKQYLDAGESPDDARRDLLQVLASNSDMLANAVTGSLAFGAAGRAVRGTLPGMAGAGLATRMGTGAAEAGVPGAAMGFTSDIAQQHLENKARGSDEDAALGHALKAAGNMGLEFGVFGGVGGIRSHKYPDGRRRNESTTPTVEQTDARGPDSTVAAAIAAEAPRAVPSPAETPGPVGAGAGSDVDIPAYRPREPEALPRTPDAAGPVPGPTDLAATTVNQGAVASSVPEARPVVTAAPEPVAETPPAAAPVVAPVPRETAPTVPETRATLLEQQKQLIDGTRKVQMFPEGTKPLRVPKGMGVIKVGNDVFHYRPAEIKANEIRTAAREGRLNDVLDLGPLSKDDVLQRAAAGEPPVAVTERTPDGTEVKTSAATAPTANIQAAHLEATKTPGNTVQAEHPAKTIDERLDALAREAETTPDITPEERFAGKTGLKDALDAASSLGFNSDRATRGVEWALQNGRRDIAEAIVGRAERNAERSAASKPRVSEDNPRYAGIADALKKAADSDSKLAKTLREKLDKPEAPDSAEALARKIAGKGRVLRDEGADEGWTKLPGVAEEEAKAAAPPKEEKKLVGTGEGGKRSKAQKAQRVTNAEIAKRIFEATPTATLPTDKAERTAFKAELGTRLRSQVDQALADGMMKEHPTTKKLEPGIQSKINYENASPHAVWLSEAQRILNKIEKKTIKYDEIEKFLGSEHALRKGDDTVLREARKEGGEEYGKARRKEAAPRETEKGGEPEEAATRVRETGESPEDRLLREETEREAGLTEEEPVVPVREREPVVTKEGEGYTAVKPREGFAIERRRARMPEKVREKVELARKREPDIVAHEEAPAEAGVETPEQARERARAFLEWKRNNDKDTLIPGYGNHRAEVPVKKFGDFIREHAAKHGGYRGVSEPGLNRIVISQFQRTIGRMASDVPVYVVSSKTMGYMNRSVRDRAFYDPKHKHIVIRSDILSDPVAAHGTILHEGVHAAIDHLADKNVHVRALITDMASYVENYLKARYNLTQLPHGVRYAFKRYDNNPQYYHEYREFMTQAMGNSEFQHTLGDIPAPVHLVERLGMGQQRMNMWQLFINAVRHKLGFAKNQHSMLEAVMRATEQIAEIHDREHGTTPGDIIRTPEGPQIVAHEEETTRSAVTDFIKNKTSDAIENVTTKPVERVVTSATNALTDVGSDMGRFGRFLETTAQYVERSMKYFPGEREQNVLRKIHDTIERMGVVARQHQVLGTKLLGEMYYLSKKLPAAFDRFSRLINEATMYGIDPSARIGEGRNGYLALSKEAQRKLDRGAKWEDVVKKDVNAKHIEAHDNYERLRREYEELNKIDPRFGEYMERSFQAFDKHQHEATRLILRNYLRTHYEGASEHIVGARADEILNAKMSDDYKQYLKDLFAKGDTAEDREKHGNLIVRDIENIRKMSGKEGVYAPLMRRGDYVVHGEYKLEAPANAKAIGDRGDTFSFDTREEAVDFARKSGLHHDIESAYYDPTTGEKTTKSGGLSVAGTPTQKWEVQVNRKHVEFAPKLSEAKRRHEELSATGHLDMRPVEEREQFFRSEHELTSQGVKAILKRQEQTQAYKRATPEGQQQMRRAVQEASIMMQAGNRVQSRRLPRRRIEGASSDFLNNFDTYNHAISNYRAKLEYRPQVEAHLQEMRDQKDQFNRENYGKADDGLKRSKIVNEMTKRAHAEDPNDYTGKWAAFSKKLSTWSYIYRMGRISHILLHQTHLPMITTPILAARHFVRAPIEVARMFSQIAGKSYKAGASDALTAAVRDGFHSGTDYMGLAKKVWGHLPDGKRLMDAFQGMADIGYIHPQYEVEVSRHLPSQQSKIPGFRQLDYGINRFDTVFRHVTNASEMINRLVGFGAAYRLEFAKLTREGMKEHDAHEHAVEYARNILSNTEGVYSTTNAAPIFKTWARPFLQFRQFPQMMYNLMGKTLVKALGKDATMKERVEALSSLSFLLGTHTVMTGALGGLPLESGKILLTATHGLGVTDSDWGDVERWQYDQAVKYFGKEWAGRIMHGLARELGIDAHHRLGLNSFFTFGMPEGNEVNQKGMSAFFFNQMAGAPVGLVQDAGKGIGKLMDGDFGGGAAQLSPQFVRDIYKAWNSGGPMFKYTKPGETAARMLGFTPSSEAEYFERRTETKSQAESYKAERMKLTYKWVDAAPGDKAKAWAAIQKWNQGRDSDSKITMDQLTKAAKNKKKTEKDLVSGVRLNKQTKFIGDRANAIY